MVSFYARDELGLGPLERGVVLACFGAAGLRARPPARRGRAADRARAGGHHRRGALGRLRRAARAEHLDLAAGGALDARRAPARSCSGRASTRSPSRPCPATAAERPASSAPSASPAARSRRTSSCRSTTRPVARLRGLCGGGVRDRAARARDPPALRRARCRASVSFDAMSDCIFCGIAAGTMPAERVHEDERTVAFLDIYPACDGHVLVIPRAHADDIHGADPADLAACAATAQPMAGARQRRARLRRRHDHAVQWPRGRADRLPLPRARHPALRGRRVLLPWKPGPASAEELARMGALLRGEMEHRFSVTTGPRRPMSTLSTPMMIRPVVVCGIRNQNARYSTAPTPLPQQHAVAGAALRLRVGRVSRTPAAAGSSASAA